MSILIRRQALCLLAVLFLLTGGTAIGASPSPEFDAGLSLTGNCQTSAVDPVPDPSCPYPLPPGGPEDRFKEPAAIAIDSFGNEYVASFAGGVPEDGRVDVFDDEGKFLTEVATPKPKSIAADSKGNLYVFESDGNIVRYEPSVFEPEAGDVDYKSTAIPVATVFFVGAVAIDAASDQLLVAHQGKLTRYKSVVEGGGEIETVEPEGIGPWTEAISVDSVGRRIAVSYCANANLECRVKVIDADAPHSVLADLDGSTTPVGEFLAISGRLGLAFDEQSGDLFVADVQAAKRVYQFDSDYELSSEINSSNFQATTIIQIAVSNGERELAADPCAYPTDPPPVPGDACNRHYLFVPVVKSNGNAFAFHPTDVGTPEIIEVLTASIGRTEAELRAVVNPRGADTDYVIEYVTQDAFEEEEFSGALVGGEGTIPKGSLPKEIRAFVSDLVPGESYRFRVRASNEVGAADEVGQNEASFSTYDDALISQSCPNQTFRIEAGATHLPDCRSYELVTPADTGGRPPRGVGYINSLFTTLQASPGGDKVSFKIEGGSLPGTSGVAGFEGDPYLSTRSSSGWSTRLVGPSGNETTLSIPASTSPDQEYSFWQAGREGTMVVNGEETEYIRYPDGHSDLIGRGSLGSDPKAEGKLITENGTHIVFHTNNAPPATLAVQLEPNAPPSGTEAVYDRITLPSGEEQTHVVSLLPGDVTPVAGQNAEYVGASKDGEGIAFSIGEKLYLRVGNEATYEIGQQVEYATVTESGDRIFYVEEGDFKFFDTSSEEVGIVGVTGDAVPVNVADGGTRAYFVSEKVLGADNPEGDQAQAGEQNLYLSEEGEISFVATVTERDVNGDLSADNDGLGLLTEVGHQLARDPSRSNPTGSVFLFQSRAEITGYPESGFPQIYRYDSVAPSLDCISCDPTGTPPTGGASLESYTLDAFSPRPFSPSAFIPNLTPDGKRIFFESTEALVSTDTDQLRDVYEWEAPGIGTCDRKGGCVYLISSGLSSRENFLYAHSRTGADVFFTTGDVLTGWDTGEAVSIYDARVNGGFPEPQPDQQCVADGCRPTTSPDPPPPSVQSSSQGSGGNLKATNPRKCPKGKRKVKKNGRVRCVKKKQKENGAKAKSRAGADRGTGK